jgi:hypothetical protein
LNQWLDGHPAIRQALNALGKIEPAQIRTRLENDPTMLNEFDHFMTQHPKISWGKPSVYVGVRLGEGASEKHTNNNSTTEVIIVSP